MQKAESIAEAVEQRERQQKHLTDALEQAAANRAEHAKRASPILDELAVNGFPVSSIRDLRVGKLDYTAAVPILLKWLPGISDPFVKTSIVLALRINSLRNEIVPVILNEFARLSEEDYSMVKWQIGDSMTYLADDQAFDRIASLLQDKKHGKSREMLAVSLGRMKTRAPDAVRLLTKMLAEADMPGHVMMALRKLNAIETRQIVERYLNHKMTWIRNEAKKTIAKFDKLEHTQK